MENYRAYLEFIGRSQLDDQLRAKVDLSGVIQQTFWEISQSQDQFQQLAPSECTPWVRRVFVNNLLDEIRRFRTQMRDAGREHSLDQALQQSTLRLSLLLASPDLSPSERVSQDEQSVRLATAMTQLPDLQRQAIEMHHFQGLPLAQIGTQLGRSKGAVAALIFRGMKQLKKQLQTSESTDGE